MIHYVPQFVIFQGYYKNLCSMNRAIQHCECICVPQLVCLGKAYAPIAPSVLELNNSPMTIPESSICFPSADVPVGAGSGQPVNGAMPSLPSPTMPTFNMAAQTPNGQPGGQEPVYTNGLPPQTYQARE